MQHARIAVDATGTEKARELYQPLPAAAGLVGWNHFCCINNKLSLSCHRLIQLPCVQCVLCIHSSALSAHNHTTRLREVVGPKDLCKDFDTLFLPYAPLPLHHPHTISLLLLLVAWLGMWKLPHPLGLQACVSLSKRTTYISNCVYGKQCHVGGQSATLI